MRVAFRLLVLIPALVKMACVSAQSLDDPRLDPQVSNYLQRQTMVPVLIRLEGRGPEVRETWRMIARALGNQYGRSETPPNRRQEIFAEVNRFGLMLVLSFDQVEEIYLPFEITLPGD